MSNGENFFKASKPTRHQAFAFDNPNPPATENTELVHPFPVPLGQGQKVGHLVSPRESAEGVTFEGSPFGGDKNTSSHLQPPASEKPALPGEQPDPRCMEQPRPRYPETVTFDRP